MTDYIIGIDLGTTNSCVGIWSDNKVQIITNNDGLRTTPSTITFKDNEILIGQPNPRYTTIKSVKRFIGKSFDDKTVQKDSKIVGYNVQNIDGEIKIENYTPCELSSFILKKLKYLAEDYIGENVKKAVITVPAYFNDRQRKETKKAGELAGLDVLRIINEPTAASLAYGLHKKQEQKILVYDTGGGTLDVTLLQLDNGFFEVISTSGDTHLGGDDFDNKLVVYCLDMFCRKYRSFPKTEVITNKKTLERVKQACKLAKEQLTTNNSTNIVVDSLFEGIDFICDITKSRFEQMCDDLFKRSIKPIDKVLDDAKLKPENIDEIVLVGGSSRMPKLREIIKHKFNGKELNISINPDEAVAYGATIQAAMICGEFTVKDIVLCDVTPLTLGLESKGGLMAPVIKRNTKIPTTKEEYFTTFSDNQPDVVFKVYEGERSLAKNNHLLGKFTLKNLPMMPRCEPKIKVIFKIDVNGILFVSATEEHTNQTISVIFNQDRNTLKTSKLLEDAETNFDEDIKSKDNIINTNKYSNYLYNTSKLVNSYEFKSKIKEEQFICIINKLKEEKDWIMSNNNITKSDIDKKMEYLDSLIVDYL